jgi:hypothetical protein
LNGIRYPVVELRQYTLHPGRRDVLIDLFDREFVETQEAARMAVLGQFRDLDDSDRFVWLRGFDDMRRRAPAFRPPPPPGTRSATPHRRARLSLRLSTTAIARSTSRLRHPGPRSGCALPLLPGHCCVRQRSLLA